MIRIIIKLYIYIIIIDAILSYFPQYRNKDWAKIISKLANFTQDPIRKLIPKDLPFDPTPLVVIILLNLLMVLW